MTTKPRWYLLLALVVVFGGLVGYLAKAGPVLFSYAEAPSQAPQPVWSLLNPLRSRAPERAADGLLRALRDGHAREALGRLQADPPIREDFLRSEETCRLLNWRLVDRQDSPGHVKLGYRATRADYPRDSKRPIWVELREFADSGSWHVTSFSAVY